MVGMAALQEGLAELRAVEGSRKEILESDLANLAKEVADLCHSPIDYQASDKPPPKSIALAMGLAIHSQPHVALTLGAVRSESTEPLEVRDLPMPEVPVVRPPDILREALGLQDWELEDLREEVDRRAARALKQERAVTWLWRHFGLPGSAPEPLFHNLFPGISGRIGTIGLVRRGTQLYALLDQPSMPDQTVYLTWQSQHTSDARPVGTFRGRYVAEDLRSALGKAIGANDEEVVTLLDQMVAVAPRSSASGLLGHDSWRVRGTSLITGLASPYPCASWLEGRVWPEAIPTDAWVAVEEGELRAARPRSVFDKLALIRTTVMMRQVYAEFLAHYTNDPDTSPTDATLLPTYDIGFHMRAVLSPLLEWAADPSTADHVANKHGVPVEEADRVLRSVHRTWSEQAAAVWWGTCKNPDQPTVQGNLALHLMATASALSEILSRRPEPLAPHRDVLFLFLGHYFANAPIQRLWTKTDAPPEINPVGRYFWGTWRRIVERAVDMEHTNWGEAAGG